ncbi:50S ribosomal protein L33 [endosymbiont DhMRE of Dentiscutata heterogama]|uniref:50S ribosomal protein L33 n=1 Tax=endosymbiont DhMRE of Dentiscutata heterogama TaxID=1609546 RepID=UPI000629D84B|nr:50S ribosomal protein L33 [endosymbiont DhMRE of Dentiscutata heterogama]CFW93141.1 50S ribosomal protein L33 [endosymbiont DhMRE of Dentiscutata heterogama]
MRVDLFLVCGGCQKRHQNYRTSKAKKPQGEKLSLKKYCKFCQKTIAHKEEAISSGKKKKAK